MHALVNKQALISLSCAVLTRGSGMRTRSSHPHGQTRRLSSEAVRARHHARAERLRRAPAEPEHPRPLHGRDHRPRRQGLRSRLHHARRRSGHDGRPDRRQRQAGHEPSAPTGSPPPTSPWAARPASSRGPSPSRATARSSSRARPSATRRAAATPPAIPTSRSCASTPPGNSIPSYGTDGVAKVDLGPGRVTTGTTFVGDTSWGLGVHAGQQGRGLRQHARRGPPHRRGPRAVRRDQRRRCRTRPSAATDASWSTWATRPTARGT